MRPRGPARRVLAACFAAAVLLPSCSTAPSSSPEAPRSRAGAPRDGTILYHEPLPSVGQARRETPPKMLLFTTAEEEIAEQNSFQTYAGAVGRRTDTNAIARRLLGSRKASARLLTPSRFAELWSRLEEAGLFELPVHRGTEPPTDTDYFLIQDGKKRWIFTRPAVQSPPVPEDPGVAQLQRWVRAELELFQFLNEP